MSKQPEALRLAEHLVDMSNKYRTPSHERGVVNGAIQELRRLHAANAELVEALEELTVTCARFAIETESAEPTDALVNGLLRISKPDSPLGKAMGVITKHKEQQ